MRSSYHARFKLSDVTSIETVAALNLNLALYNERMALYGV